MEAFEKWLTEEGGQFGNLKLSYDTEVNRILKASNDIKKKEECLFIPEHCFVNLEAAKKVNNPIWQKLNSGEESSAKATALNRVEQLMLMEENAKGKDSFWYHYIQTLPAIETDNPHFWSEQMLQLLKGSYITEEIMRVDIEANKNIKDAMSKATGGALDHISQE